MAVSLTTQEEAPSGPPRGVRVEAVSSTQLRVTWQVREQLCCVVKLETNVRKDVTITEGRLLVDIMLN